MSKQPLVDFSDLEEPIWNDSPAADPKRPDNLSDFGSKARPGDERFVEKCVKCSGRGRFISYSGRDIGPCFKCDGKGSIAYRTSPEQRSKGRASANKAKVAKQIEKHSKAVAWAEANPAEAKWLLDNRESFDFARSLSDSLQKYGSLTEGQLGAIRKCIAKSKARSEAKVERESNAPDINMAGMMEAFNKALESGLKAPKIVIDDYRISLAKAGSRNEGCLYITDNNPQWDDRTYYGKCTPDGKFVASRACDEATVADILDVSQNLLERAVAHGKATGNCCMCNRELTDPVSVERGIGPICEGRWL